MGFREQVAFELGQGGESALFGGNGNGLQGKGTAEAQVCRQPGLEHGSGKPRCAGSQAGSTGPGTESNGREVTWMSFTDVAQGTGAQQAQAAELALGLRALSLPTPALPSPPPRPGPRRQPGYSCCRSEAWSLQENTGPPEPGFSVMF